jgi:methionyl-tRNA synthetase
MYDYTSLASQIQQGGVAFKAFLLFFILWSLFWKGWSLWLAARRGEKGWFTALLIVNTMGLLEIIYIFAIAKRKDTKTAKNK